MANKFIFLHIVFFLLQFLLLCFTRFPWNQQKLSGYVAEKVLDLLIGATYFLALAAVLLLFISLCLHHRTFLKIFEYVLIKVGQSDKNGHQHDAKIICDLIRFHSRIKEYVAYSIFSKNVKSHSSYRLFQLNHFYF